MLEATNAPAVVLGRDDLPAVFRLSDDASKRAQEVFFTATRLRLAMLVVAGGAGGFTWSLGRADLAAVVGACALVAAIMVESYLLRQRPEREWYEGRAAAETARSLAWRYAVRGDPFPSTLSAGKAAELLVARLRQIPSDLRTIELRPSLEHDSQQIGARMKALRDLPLEQRKAAYLDGRVRDQRTWYSSKSVFHGDRARRFGVAMIVAEATGVIGAVLQAAGLLGDLDPTALAPALAASIGAWAQAKQHQTLSRAYGIAALELVSIAELVPVRRTEAQWSRFVEDAEEAISREHTLWRAGRGMLPEKQRESP
ncbi:MAG: DUF4231 domain-containing protein [Actinomycetota bacterium]